MHRSSEDTQHDYCTGIPWYVYATTEENPLQERVGVNNRISRVSLSILWFAVGAIVGSVLTSGHLLWGW